MKITKINRVSFRFLMMVWIAIVCFTACSKQEETDSPIQRGSLIIDQLENAGTYFEMHPLFEKAFAFLNRSDLAELPTGRHEIEGDRLFGIVSRGPGKSRTEATLEAHRKYIDIQYIIEGIDEMGWKPTVACMYSDVTYNPDDDIEFFKDNPQIWIKVPAGSFAIFFPKDAHAPMVSSGEIHKVVLKVAVE